MSTSIRTLRVLLHLPSGERRSVAFLSQFGDIVRLSFEESYIEDAARPALSLAYRGATESDTRAILRATRDVRLVRSDGHLPTWFSNLLPEGHNRQRLARERGCSESDEFELLAAAGRDLAGAVELEPLTGDAIPPAVLAWHASMGLEVAAAELVAEPVLDAASLAGLVTKFSAIKEGRRYVVKRHGQAGAYILKLPSTRHPDWVDNELTGYRLAGVLDLDCAEVARVPRREVDLPDEVEFAHVLAVKRFDRGEAGRRVHMEEMAQAMQFEPRRKYGRGLELDFPAMLRLLDRLSGEPARDVKEAVRRLVAFILMGNTDAHLKNWALIYPGGVTPTLSPLYDPVCVTAWFDELAPQEYALNRRIDAELSSLDWPRLRALIDAAGVPRAARLVQVAKETVKQAKAKWPGILRDAPPNVRKSVSARLAGGVALASL
ncbi:MAG: HipA domain-containing protein [Myxococcales bacterium]|nr:HipA domain-containing protein [Myxococcales bacterium]